MGFSYLLPCQNFITDSDCGSRGESVSRTYIKIADVVKACITV
jgi:hypothetical protein